MVPTVDDAPVLSRRKRGAGFQPAVLPLNFRDVNLELLPDCQRSAEIFKKTRIRVSIPKSPRFLKFDEHLEHLEHLGHL